MIPSTLAKCAALVLCSALAVACSSTPTNSPQPLGSTVKTAPAPLALKSTPRGPAVVLDDVLFDFDKASLRASSSTVIAQAAAWMKANPGARALVEGHTDDTGDAAFNQQLSHQRSESVRNALIAEGIPAQRIRQAGFGETRPVANNATREGRQENRRVEIIFQTPQDRAPI